MGLVRRAGVLAALAAAPLGLAYRFALIYRQRAGYRLDKLMAPAAASARPKPRPTARPAK